MSRQLMGDLAGLVAIIACVVVLSLAPGLRTALASMDLWAWGGLGALFLLWMVTRRPARRLS
jgi:hypothetical protein